MKMSYEELLEEKAQLIKAIEADEKKRLEMVKEDQLKNEIEQLKKALKGPSPMNKINKFIEERDMKTKLKKGFGVAKEFFKGVQKYADSLEPIEAIKGKKKKK